MPHAIADRELTPIYSIGAETGFLLAGRTGTQGFMDGIASKATFRQPAGIAVSTDGTGVVYVVDTGNHCVRKITPTANVFSRSFSQTAGSSGAGPMGGSPQQRRGSAAGLGGPDSMLVSTVAGRGGAGYVNTDSKPTLAQFHSPVGIAIDSITGAIYVADDSNNVIRKIEPDSGAVSTYAGGGGVTATNGDDCPPAGLRDGPALGSNGSGGGGGGGALFNGPTSVLVDQQHNLLVVDSGNHRIAKVAWKDSTHRSTFTFLIRPSHLLVCRW